MTHVDTDEYDAFVLSCKASFAQVRRDQAETSQLVAGVQTSVDRLLSRSAILSGLSDGDSVIQFLADLGAKVTSLEAALVVPESSGKRGIVERFLIQIESNWLLWFCGFVIVSVYSVVKTEAAVTAIAAIFRAVFK